MENKKYVVNRDDIYVGEVVRADRIYRSDWYDRKDYLYTNAWYSYRSMLFVPNERKFSNDLLYRTPNYPVLNVTDDATCLELEQNSIVIIDAYNLSSLLEYFGYQKDLTYEDIYKIRQTFFTGRFAQDNCELFGFKEIMAEDLTFYTNGEVVTNPRKLERRRRQFRAEQQAGHRMFSGVSESPLPREYWDILDDRGDNTLMDVVEGWDEKMNAFAPHKEEGPVKRLKRF